MTGLLGEPFSTGRLLMYLRNSEVFLCGWPLEGELVLSPLEVAEAVALIAKWDVTALHIWGQSLVDLSAMAPAWRPWYQTIPGTYDFLTLINFANYDDRVVRRNRNFRRARQHRYHLAHQDGFPGPDVVGPLAAAYLVRPDIPPLQKSLIELSQCPDLYQDTTSFLVLQEDEVVGMQVCRPLSNSTVLARWALFRDGARGASDFLYLRFLDHYRRAGTAMVDLGYGSTTSLFQYKKRWGANSFLGPVQRYGFRLGN